MYDIRVRLLQLTEAAFPYIGHTEFNRIRSSSRRAPRNQLIDPVIFGATKFYESFLLLALSVSLTVGFCLFSACMPFCLIWFAFTVYCLVVVVVTVVAVVAMV